MRNQPFSAILFYGKRLMFVSDKFEFCREENRNRMRRSDREVKDFDGIIRIMEKCDVCRIALNNNGYPYILPLNFGMKVDNNIVELYFHGAN